MRRLAALSITLLLAVACRTSTGPGDGLVTARASTQGIVLENRSDRPAHYLAYTPGWLALVDLVPCSDVNDPCPRLAPGATLTIPWTSVGGYSASETSYRVSWSLVGLPPVSGDVDLRWPPFP